jgi:hypothetical protein
MFSQKTNVTVRPALPNRTIIALAAGRGGLAVFALSADGHLTACGIAPHVS